MDKCLVKSIPRVLVVLSSVNKGGGVQSKIMDLYRQVDKEKLQFDFLILSKGKLTFEEEILKLGGKIHFLGSKKDIGIKKLLINLNNLMRKEKYIAVHSLVSLNDSLILLIALINKIRIRISHSRGSDYYKPINVNLARILKVVIHFTATHKIASSKKAGKFLFIKNDFEVVLNSFNYATYTKMLEKPKEYFKKSIGVPTEKIVIGNVARFIIGKNHKFFISLAKELLKRNIDFHIVLVGEGEVRESILENIKEHNLEAYFSLFDNQDNIEEFYRAFDVFLLPSISEGFGNVVVEAQAAGTLAIVSYAVPNEVDLGIGLLKHANLEKIDEWISLIINRKDLLEEINRSEMNNILLKKGFDINSTADKMFKIYKI